MVFEQREELRDVRLEEDDSQGKRGGWKERKGTETETVREGPRESLSKIEWSRFVYIAHSLAIHSCLKMSE